MVNAEHPAGLLGIFLLVSLNLTRTQAARDKGRSAGAWSTLAVAMHPIHGSHTVANDYNDYWTRPDASIVGTRTNSPPDYSRGLRTTAAQ